MDFLLHVHFVPFVPSINSQQRMKSAQFQEVVPWLLRMESKASLSQFVKLRKARIELNMFGWRYPVVCLFVCLILFVGYAIKMFRFSSWWDWKKSSSHCFEAGVNMSAFSVFRAEQLLRELSDQGFDDARHLLSDLAGTRSELWKKGGDFERWEVQELVGKWTTRLSAKTRDFGAVWATFSCYGTFSWGSF